MAYEVYLRIVLIEPVGLLSACYEVYLSDPGCEFSLLHNDPTSLPDYKLTDLYFERLEDEIRKHPECYLWTHNRFKYAKN